MTYAHKRQIQDGNDADSGYDKKPKFFLSFSLPPLFLVDSQLYTLG